MLQGNLLESIINSEELEIIIDHLIKKLQSPPKKWRKIDKTYKLITVLLDNGDKRIQQNLKNNIFLIEMHINYNYIEDGVDRGIEIRKLSKIIYDRLLNKSSPLNNNTTNNINNSYINKNNSNRNISESYTTNNNTSKVKYIDNNDDDFLNFDEDDFNNNNNNTNINYTIKNKEEEDFLTF